MTPSWDGAEPSVLPPLRAADRLRLAVRGPLAAASLGVMFGLFLLVRGVDWWLERIALRPVTRFGQRIVQAWAAQALPLIGLRIIVQGTPMRAAGVYVANHSSWIDVVALQRAAAPYLVSKSEVRDWPGIGLIGRAIGTLFIDRRPSPAEARRQQIELGARLARGDRMALFPEGTSTDGRRILPFKSTLFAVFVAQGSAVAAAVQPVTISYHVGDGLPRTFYNWWGDMAFAPHLIGLLARSSGGRVVLCFHAPIPLAGGANRKALALAAEAAVRRGFDAASGAD